MQGGAYSKVITSYFKQDINYYFIQKRQQTQPKLRLECQYHLFYHIRVKEMQMDLFK